MLRQAPPLQATEAFLVAVRAPSFRAAADEMALSPSAFSRRIQMLEAFVGVALFDRSGAAVRLTEAGRLFYDDVSPALDAIRRATVRLRDRAKGRILRLATSHSLAVGWLIPRLHRLLDQHGIEIDLSVSRDPQLLRSGEADLALWGGRDDLAEFGQEPLIELCAVLASAPRLADGRMPPACCAELAKHRLLTAKAPQRYWERWLAEMDPARLVPEPSARYDTTEFCYEAAAGGLGVTLAVPLLSERFAADGRLVSAIGPAVPLGYDYRLFYATSDVARRAPVRDFAEWLVGEVAVSSARYGGWSTAAATGFVGGALAAGSPPA